MFRINKKFAFSASHELHGLRENHPCGRLHGHNYEVEVSLVGDGITPVGWIMDFGDLDFVKQLIDKTLDHRHLNDVMADENPTSENLARWLYLYINGQLMDTPGFGDLEEGFILERVRVGETPKTFAEYFGD